MPNTPPDVYPHQLRRTFTHDWLDNGGAEGDLTQPTGWTDRSILDRYGADLQVQRTIQAKQRIRNVLMATPQLVRTGLLPGPDRGPGQTSP